MEYISQIITTTLESFDFGFCAAVNILTYRIKLHSQSDATSQFNVSNIKVYLTKVENGKEIMVTAPTLISSLKTLEIVDLILTIMTIFKNIFAFYKFVSIISFAFGV